MRTLTFTKESLIDKFSIAKLKKSLSKIKVTEGSSYLISYPEFLEYFQKRKRLSRHDVIIGIHFAYGWMPRIITLNPEHLDEVVKILNGVKQGILIEEEELSLLKKTFNNSLVGTSKLLHFINPDLYPIWDSRVFRYLNEKKPSNQQINKNSSYLTYTSFCNYIADQKDYTPIHEAITNKMGMKLTRIRTLELLMFYGGK